MSGLIEWLHQNFSHADAMEILHRLESLDGCESLLRETQGPAAQQDDAGKWDRVGQLAGDRINQTYNHRLATDPGFAASAFMQYEGWVQSGQVSMEAVAPLIHEAIGAHGGVPTPVERSILSLPREEQPKAIEKIVKTAETRGLTPEQYVQALNQMAETGASAELISTRAAEAQAQHTLEAIGKERYEGMTAQQSLGAVLRAQAEGKLYGSRQMPFDPKLTQEQKNREFIKTVPAATVNEFRKRGINPEAYLAKTLDAVNTASIHDEVAGRLARRDAVKAPMPKTVPNESSDRRADLHRAFAAHQTTPEQLAPSRRHTVGNDRELAVRAAYAEHTGQSPEQFEKDTYVPPAVAAEYEDVEVPGKDDEDDSPRADLARAFQQHGG